MTGNLHKDPRAFMIIYRLIIFRMRNVWGKRCRENQNTHFRSGHFDRLLACLGVIVENMVERDRPQMTVEYGTYPLHVWYLHSFYLIINYFFITAKLVTLTRLSITVYVHWLSLTVDFGWAPSQRFVSVSRRARQSNLPLSQMNPVCVFIYSYFNIVLLHTRRRLKGSPLKFCILISFGQFLLSVLSVYLAVNAASLNKHRRNSKYSKM
jgi:hypothetical protein